MPDERIIGEIEQILTEIVELGAEKERTKLVPNLLVTNASPAGLTNFIVVRDDRDGDNILAAKVPGIVYNTNDLVNVLFVKGGEAIAFQQGSASSSSGSWGIVLGSSTDIFYNAGDVVIGKTSTPDAALEILDASQAQLRLTHTDATKFVDFTLDTNADLTITPSGTGDTIFNCPVQIQDDGDTIGGISTQLYIIPDSDNSDASISLVSTRTASDREWNIRAGTGGGSPNTNLRFYDVTAGADRLNIDSNGRVMIGTTSNSGEQLSVKGAAGQALNVGFFTGDEDDGDNLNFVMYALGGPNTGVANRSRLLFGYDQPNTRFRFQTEAQGTGTLRPMVFETEGNSNQLRVETDGNIGFLVASPQGQLHAYDSISGFLIWEYDGLNATVRTIVPNGAGDCLYRLHAAYVLRDSAGAVASGTTDVSNAASVNLTVGGNTVRLRVNADGSIDTSRTAGTDTIKVAYTLRWL